MCAAGLDVAVAAVEQPGRHGRCRLWDQEDVGMSSTRRGGARWSVDRIERTPLTCPLGKHVPMAGGVRFARPRSPVLVIDTLLGRRKHRAKWTKQTWRADERHKTPRTTAVAKPASTAATRGARGLWTSWRTRSSPLNTRSSWPATCDSCSACLAEAASGMQPSSVAAWGAWFAHWSLLGLDFSIISPWALGTVLWGVLSPTFGACWGLVAHAVSGSNAVPETSPGCPLRRPGRRRPGR